MWPYLSPDGKADRKTFLLRTVHVLAVSGLIGTPVFLIFQKASQANHLPSMFVSGMALLTILIVGGWSCLALQIQRLHDQGYSGQPAVVATVVSVAAPSALSQAGFPQDVVSVIGLSIAIGYVAWLILAESKPDQSPSD